jgi:hypothetical protein
LSRVFEGLPWEEIDEISYAESVKSQQRFTGFAAMNVIPQNNSTLSE